MAANEKKKYFDMENLLTRSLYRVLNQTNRVPEHIHHPQNHQLPSFSIEKSAKNVNFGVARPNNHRIGVQSPDLQMQMRLLAQEICSRMERKYEKKLEDIRDKDRRETDRRLGAIRAEFEAKYHVQLSRLEKEKQRQDEEFAERLENQRIRADLCNSQKDADFDARRRVLDNLQAELALNRTNFEKIKEEFGRKMDLERENLRLERERVEMQREPAMSRVAELQRENRELRAKIEGLLEYQQELQREKEKTRILTQNLRESEKRREIQHAELKSLQKLAFSREKSRKPQKIAIRQASSSSDSELSEGELEILNIRQRIQNLDEIARDLDATIEHFGGGESRGFEEQIGKYDDFCRALSNSHESSTHDSPKTSSPQKKIEPRRKLDFSQPEISVAEPKNESKIEHFEPEKLEKPAEKVEEPKSEIFQGVDPVMAEYMKKIMARNQKKNRNSRNSPKSRNYAG
ncbi:unnamed protein product [Caenorhabditis angaria]|uniref:Uncharacterized protein n=1 Tax=Caenorhabditis angaria TaxID=860376 RepID=A0A9P1N3Y1_9PELO|nr:unnamed protein product [Caenorhabditis angaria]